MRLVTCMFSQVRLFKRHNTDKQKLQPYIFPKSWRHNSLWSLSMSANLILKGRGTACSIKRILLLLC